MAWKKADFLIVVVFLELLRFNTHIILRAQMVSLIRIVHLLKISLKSIVAVPDWFLTVM